MGRHRHGEGLSDEQIGRFTRAWQEGVEIELVGERFALSRSAVSSIARRLNLRPKVARRPRGKKIIAALVVLMLATPGLFVPGAAAAPPPGADPSSEIGLWFRSLQNSSGEFCCSVADCRRPYAWRQTTGKGYQVEAAEGSPWLDVPPENILRRANLLGDAIACIVGNQVRCFIAPPET